ncbi:hypothetical protein GCM10011506_22520 [Marivirga lumbricoides]|uniref:Uncharacterized protein n=1 Tax=Marivirga lumbricoides TaxID=1046115 RepID=A0ABQ1M8P6_9BACT|nr:hypothetical protein GCM10011506_22520 [Marivirga lumbricoides]
MSEQRRLMQQKKEYEESISHQLQEYTDKAQEIGKTALMIAGGALVAYQLVRLFTKRKSSAKSSRPKVKGKVYQGMYEGDDDGKGPRTIVIKEDSGSLSMFDLIKAEMGGLLLAIAKDKILAFLHQLESPKTNASEQHKEDN